MTHTRPLDALGIGCEINREKQTPGGWELKTSQTMIQHTPATVKVKAKCKPSNESEKEGFAKLKTSNKRTLAEQGFASKRVTAQTK